MIAKAVTGQSWEMTAPLAGEQAARQAVDRLGRAPASFGWVVSSSTFPLDEVLAGVLEVTGEVPLVGLSSSAEIGPSGRSQKSVLVGLLSGSGLNARVGWWPDFHRDSRKCVAKMLEDLQPQPDTETLLVAGDGMGTDAHVLVQELSGLRLAVSGCLTGGELSSGKTYQSAGRRSGSGGLACAILGGEVTIGAGVGHGWQPAGALTRVTRVQGPWVRTLDGQPPNEVYARYFGNAARNWVYPPLNDLVRLYPLGSGGDGQYSIHAPIRIEADGSLRMNVPLEEGSYAYLMIGTQDRCATAVRQAASQALAGMNGVTPRLALLFVDAAWAALLDLEPAFEVQALRSVLGDNIPVMGAYTLGQIHRASLDDPPQLLNQHIEVVLLG
ncbi:MAG: FIST C-terminal domain-containing protein [Anaerolineales bacterium]|nr:FIST C-terminal domain-containing protein [Anaerolineales bacterium]